MEKNENYLLLNKVVQVELHLIYYEQYQRFPLPYFRPVLKHDESPGADFRCPHLLNAVIHHSNRVVYGTQFLSLHLFGLLLNDK